MPGTCLVYTSPNGQIEGAGKEGAILFSDPPAHLCQAIAAAHAQGSHSKKGQSHPGDQKSKNSRPYVAPGHLTHGNGKYQVSRTKKKAEQHAGHSDILLKCKFTLHDFLSLFF